MSMPKLDAASSIAIVAVIETLSELPFDAEIPESHVYLVGEHAGTSGMELVRFLVAAEVLERKPGPTLARGRRFHIAAETVAQVKREAGR